jgi:diguanylate cyclase (GGDEF)-like protein
MDIPSIDQTPVTLLYVEDDETTQKLIIKVLNWKFPQINLLLADNGQTGLELFTARRPDIVLTDIRMPVMNGIDMAREIKKLDQGVRVIAFTASDDNDLIIEAISIGINHYVLKPIEMEKLTVSVEQCLNSINQERMLRQNEEHIRHLAYYDSLTGLANRQLFNELLHQALARAQRQDRQLAVLFLDLDRFKTINDTHGHGIGDQLLQAVGQRLHECCRRDQDTVARRGGDEFILFLSDLANVQEAAKVAQMIIDSFANPFDIAEHQLFIGTSIGISIFPNDGAAAEILIRNADMAMYCAKEAGRNCYHIFNPSIEAQACQRLALENSLRLALQNGQLILHYQPQVNIKTGRLNCIEALLRWQHPEQGLLLPGMFLTLAEETGLIVQLSEWALRSACTQNKAWQDAGFPPVRVAVNFSPRQFQNPNLAEMVARVLNDARLDPCWLELEVTEGIMLQSSPMTVENLDRLSALGVHITIDDFGTGYSSLSYIKKFPINTLKIDRSFISDITDNADDAAIATAVVNVAQSLGLNVIAEGVETESQMEFLSSINCPEMQGNFFSRPLPATEIPAILWHKSGTATKVD